MSITGIRPSDLTASEDEEEDHVDGHHDSATSISSAEASMVSFSSYLLSDNSINPIPFFLSDRRKETSPKSNRQ